MKNKLIDLNDHMFAQLERLSDEELKGDALKQEIDRSKAIAMVGRQVIDNARLALDAYQVKADLRGKGGEAPKMLGLDND